MSFSSSKKGGTSKKPALTPQEAQILERQRQVAAQLAKSKAPQDNNGSRDNPITISSPTKRPMVQTKSSTEVQKRPSLKRPGQKRPTLRHKPPPPTTAAAALAAAKSRVATETAKANKSATKQPVNDPVPKQGKHNTQLAKLVNASVKTHQAMNGNHHAAVSSYEPDDYWRSMRDWDFLKQVHPQNSSVAKVPHQNKPLPNVFWSHAHYIAAWAPLCLTEARAQLVSEFLNEVPYWTKKPTSGPQPVKVQSMERGNCSTMDCITLQVVASNRDGTSGPTFLANDLVLLVTKESVLQQAIQGKQGDDLKFRNVALVGHVEYSRKGLQQGLTVKVSKKWWAVVGNNGRQGHVDMVLAKVGSNVTALREFTALCRVGTIPLLKYLLGQPQDVVATTSSPTNTINDKKKPAQDNTHHQKTKSRKAKMLHDMGGVTALGKGFTAYAQKKFNPSQLGAISAAAREYGDGGFTLIKGPPGTGKTTTLVALLNSLHIRQFNKYYDQVRKIAAQAHLGNRKVALTLASKSKPRMLVCAPSNAAVDNVILKIMQDGLVDGNGCRYNPSMVRVGVGQSDAVKDVALESKVNTVLEQNSDAAKLDSSVAGFKMELQRVQTDITRLRKRLYALARASPWPLSKDWEIRIDEDTFEETGRVYFCNHKEKSTSYEVPPPPEPNEKQYPPTAMPEYRSYLAKVVKLVERYYSITAKAERCTIVQQGLHASGGSGQVSFGTRQELETHVLDSAHIVMTTLGTAGNRVLESAAKFEVVIVDEAAQSVEPATLAALQLARSSHAILVGDPQQLPATIFSMSGRNTKYDRSLFQRLEEAGHEVHLLNVQYRMHPAISDFPRRIFYDGNLLDGPNVLHAEYGNPLKRTLLTKAQSFEPFMVLDLDSKEERGGTSLANSSEAHLAVHLYQSLRRVTGGLSAQSRVAVITPYAQQANLLRRYFSNKLGSDYSSLVEVNTVDGFQGREANIVIFSCVRAAGSRGIGFLSDVRRMNVALTRAKHFLFVIARCQSIVVNPYWRDLVHHARETQAVVKVHMKYQRDSTPIFPDIENLKKEPLPPKPLLPSKRKRTDEVKEESEDGELHE